MKSGSFKDARVSLYVLAVILLLVAAFYLFSSMFTSMGYKAYRNANAVVHDANTQKTIVIDAGHGGEDPGAEANGLKEKDLNLSVSLLLADLMRANGYNVVMTRSEDILLYNSGQENKKKFNDLRNRVAIANDTENAIFVSIHMNKFPAEYCRGVQTFYSSNNPESAVLAESIQSSARLLQTDNKRQIKSSGDAIYVLDNLNIPAVLVECGFLSNKEESSKLADSGYRQQLALTLYCGITAYLEGINTTEG